MSQRPTVLIRSPKKEVQRYLSIYSATTTVAAQNRIIRTSTQKETLMGYKLKFSVACEAAANNQLTAFIIYKSTNGEIRAPPLAAVVSEAVDSNIIHQGVLLTPSGVGQYEHVVESKQKRKLQPGDVLYISITSTFNDVNITFHDIVQFYIGQ